MKLLANSNAVEKQRLRKLLLIMKMTAVILLITVLQVSANTSINAQKITIHRQQLPVREFIRILGQQTGLEFIFEDGLIDQTPRLDLHLEKVSLTEALDIGLKGTGLAYEIENNIVVLKKKAMGSPSLLTPEKEGPPLHLSGRVISEAGEVLQGVNITVKGASIGTVTDEAGKYNLDIPESVKNPVLVASFVGYQNAETAVNGKTSINFILKLSTRNMEDVIVIGYGTVRKGDLTGSVGQVKVSELQKAPVKSYDEALAGRVAGVQVSSADGQPGSVPNIIIRGNSSITQDNSPLFVVDGFPLEENNSNSINPSEIESIEILKDASATAIYGARAANGVVLITTKKGKGKTSIAYDAYYGVNSAIKKQELLSPYEFVKYQYELEPEKTTQLYLTDGKDLESYRNKNGISWQDEILRTAPFQNHSIAIRGAGANTSFSISGSATLQDGIVLNSGFKRYQGRVILDHQVNDRFKTGVNINYANIKSYGTKVADYGGSNNKLSLLASAWGYRPTTQGEDNSLVDLNLDPDIDPLEDYRYNPLKTARNELHEDLNTVLSLNAYGSYNLLPDLVLRVSGGLNQSEVTSNDFYSSNTRAGDINTPQGRNGPNGRVVNTTVVNLLNENTLTYKKSFRKKHNLDIMAGFTNQRRDYLRSGFTGASVPNENLGISGLDEGVMTDLTTIESYNTLSSLLGRVNYNFKRKYYLTASLRADGSSKFSPDNKWSYFPAVALAYRFSPGTFLEEKLHGNGKLRLSYGVTGNNRVSDFPYLSTVAVEREAAYSFNGVFYSGADLATLGNYDLKWENTATFNAGVDLDLFNQRIAFSIDYYHKKTYDLLLDARMAGSTGYSSAFQNIGRVTNSGLELDLKLVTLRTKDFSWNTAFNISFNRNSIKALQSGEQSLLSPVQWDGSAYKTAPIYIARTGEPIAMLYGFVFDGLYQEEDFNRTGTGGYVLKDNVPNNQSSRTAIRPGYVKYKDLNGDGQVDTKDQTIIGNPNPLHFGGFSNDFQYRDFDLSIFFQWSYGNDIYNANRLVFEGTTSYNFNQFASMANRWTPDNIHTDVPVIHGQGQPMYSSRVVEDGSYLRLKTVQLGYNLPAGKLRNLKISSLRVYASAQNLLTWTNYSGPDPEVSTYNSALTPGFDYSPYPRACTITVGLNLVL